MVNYVDYFAKQEDKEEDRHYQHVRTLSENLAKELEDYEPNLLQEIRKKIHLDGKDSVQKIKKTINNVLLADQRIQSTDVYKKNKSFSDTLSSVVDLYGNMLKEKLMEGLSDENVDKIVLSYVGFLQRKENLSEKNKIDQNKTDVDNFLDLIKENYQKDKMDKIKPFLEKVVVSGIENQKIATNKQLLKSLLDQTKRFSNKEDFSPQEREDLINIKEGLEDIVGFLNYEDFIMDFLDLTKNKDRLSLAEIDDVVLQLTKKYPIPDDKESDVINISDYLLRLKSCLQTNKRTQNNNI